MLLLSRTIAGPLPLIDQDLDNLDLIKLPAALISHTFMLRHSAPRSLSFCTSLVRFISWMFKSVMENHHHIPVSHRPKFFPKNPSADLGKDGKVSYWTIASHLGAMHPQVELNGHLVLEVGANPQNEKCRCI